MRPIGRSRNVVRMLAATLVPEHCSSGHCGKLCRWSHPISSAKGQRRIGQQVGEHIKRKLDVFERYWSASLTRHVACAPDCQRFSDLPVQGIVRLNAISQERRRWLMTAPSLPDFATATVKPLVTPPANAAREIEGRTDVNRRTS